MDPIREIFLKRWSTTYTSFFWKRGDIKIIDAYGPNGISKIISIFSKGLTIFQSGFLYHYAFVMLGGLVILLTWFVGF